MSPENENPSLSHKAIKLLVVFSTSYLREKTFSALALTKTRLRNRLDADAELRPSEISRKSLLPLILGMKLQQISHELRF